MITSDVGPAPVLTVSTAADIGEMMRRSPGGARAVAAANHRLKVVLKVAHAIGTLHKPQELSDEIMDQLKGIFPQMDQGAVMIKAVDPVDLEPVAVRGAAGVEIKLSRAVIGEVMGKRNIVLSQDTVSDDRFRERMSITSRRIRPHVSVVKFPPAEVKGKSVSIGIYAVRGVLPSTGAELDRGMIANMMATVSCPGWPGSRVVHIVWGRHADDGSIVLEALSHQVLPAAETHVTLAPALQEKPSLAPVSARIVTSGPDGPEDQEGSAVPVYRARMTVPDPPVALIELLSPGSVLNSDMSLDEMDRHELVS